MEPRFTIKTLMRLVAVVALELALLQRIFVMLLLPPVTIAVVLLNLALVYVVGRDSFLANRVVGMLMGGLVALFLMVAYYLSAGPRTGWLGPGGQTVQGLLSNLAGSQPDPMGGLALLFRRAADALVAVEAVVLDLIGLAVIWVGGRIEGRLRADATGARTPDHAKGSSS
jgi:hypothetical protein